MGICGEVSSIKRMMLAGARPEITILEKTTFAGVDAAERKWIRHFNGQFTGMKNVILLGG